MPLFGPPAIVVTSSEGMEYLSRAILYSTVTHGTLQIVKPTVKIYQRINLVAIYTPDLLRERKPKQILKIH